MSNLVISGLTTITTFTLFGGDGDGWENLKDVLCDIKKLACWCHSMLPENRFVRILFYTTGAGVLIRSIPLILRRTYFFVYHENEIQYFHRSNNHLQILEMKQELLSELKVNNTLPKLDNESLVILELNIGGGTNLSYYPKDCILLGTDFLEASKELLENNIYLDEEIGTVSQHRFIHTIPEELNSVSDNSISCVVSFHALCSSKKTCRALAEIKRVLMPGGKLYFIEHTSVKIPEERWTLQWIAQLNFRPTLWMLNCLIKNMGWYFDRAGFSKIHYQRVNVSSKHFFGPLWAVVPHIYGYAVK